MAKSDVADREPANGSGRPRVAAWALTPLAVLVALEIIALPLLLHWGRHRWFQFDEWDFLASRDLSSLHDLFAPHSAHWVTLPIVVYRAMWAIFGIRSYVPYQVLSVLAHLTIVTLVWVVMRRARVRPWTATAAVAVLLLLGSGQEHILWAFNITFAGSLAFGLVHLLLADHDGPWAPRDLLGLVAGFAGLLCSGVAVSMTIAVGIAVLIRRGWRPALLHTVPLAAAYAVWFLAIGHDGLRNQRLSSFDESLDFVREAIAVTFEGLARTVVLGWALGAVLIGGLVLAWWHLPRRELRTRAAVPAGLLVGSLAFLIIAASGRGGLDIRSNNRYVYVTAALLLPALTVAADAIMRRWRFSIALFAVLLLVSLVGNVGDFRDESPAVVTYVRQYREFFLTLPRLPVADEIPRNLYNAPTFAPWVSFGWLRDGVESGRIPEPDPMDPVIRATVEGRLVLRQQTVSRATDCEPVRAPADLQLGRGSSIRATGPISVVYTSRDGKQSLPITFQPPASGAIVAYAAARVRVDARPEWCLVHVVRS